MTQILSECRKWHLIKKKILAPSRKFASLCDPQRWYYWQRSKTTDKTCQYYWWPSFGVNTSVYLSFRDNLLQYNTSQNTKLCSFWTISLVTSDLWLLFIKWEMCQLYYSGNIWWDYNDVHFILDIWICIVLAH